MRQTKTQGYKMQDKTISMFCMVLSVTMLHDTFNTSSNLATYFTQEHFFSMKHGYSPISCPCKMASTQFRLRQATSANPRFTPWPASGWILWAASLNSINTQADNNSNHIIIIIINIIIPTALCKWAIKILIIVIRTTTTTLLLSIISYMSYYIIILFKGSC